MKTLRNWYLQIPILLLFILGQTVYGGVSYFPSTGGSITLSSVNAWTAQNEFSGQTNISGPDSGTNVEIGSTSNDANAGTGGTSVCIGNLCSITNGANNTAIGSSASTSTGVQNVVVGSGANVSGGSAGAIAIGYQAAASGNFGIALGQSSAATANTFVAGSAAGFTADVYFGKGITNTSATAYTIHGTGGSGSDNVGGNLILAPGIGTGTANGGVAIINRNLRTTTGSTTQAQTPSYISCPSKILSNTSATVQAIATITTTTTSAGAIQAFFTVTASNGTLLDSDAGEIHVAWNNNAGTVAATASAVVGAANSVASGTLATTPTVTVATNVVTLNYTPTWTVIVPTVVTGYVTIAVNGVNTVACQ